MKSIKNYKHIIWDWNGTLLDDVWICMEIINKMLQKRCLPLLSKDRYKEIFGFPIQNYYLKAGFNFEVEPFKDLAKEYIEEYDSRSQECKLHQGVLDALKKINSLGVSQSILSASSEESLRMIIESFEIQDYFSHINGLNDHYAESKIDIGERWIKAQGFKPCEVLMIGDTIHDYEVAKALGIDCVLISHGHQSIERLKDCNDMVWESVLHIYDLT